MSLSEQSQGTEFVTASPTQFHPTHNPHPSFFLSFFSFSFFSHSEVNMRMSAATNKLNPCHWHNPYFHNCVRKLSHTQSLLPLLLHPSCHRHNPYFHNCVSKLSHTQSLLPQLCIQAFTHTILTSTTVYSSFHTHNPYFHYLCTPKLSQTQSLLPLLCIHDFTHTVLTVMWKTAIIISHKYPCFHTHSPYCNVKNSHNNQP